MKWFQTLGKVAYPLATLRQRDFRLVWTAMMLGGLGAQTETLVLGWFVLELTGSPFLVGLAFGSRIVFNLLAVFAGAIADRVRRQLILSLVGLVLAVLATTMAALIYTGAIQIWQIFAITLLGGLTRTFQMPAAQSLAADAVPRERIANGVALTHMTMDVSNIAGPLLGGLLIAAYGPAGAYALIAVFHLFSGLAAILVRTEQVGSAGERGSVFRNIFDGFKYVKGQQVLWAALLVATIINLTGFPLHTTLMPIFADEVLLVGPERLGLMLAAYGVGSLLGSVGLAWVPNLQTPGRFLILAVVIWHGSMIVFSFSQTYYLSLGLLVVTGMGFSSTLVLLGSVLMRTAPPEFRGRVMGLRVLAISAHAVGAVNSGTIAGLLGPGMAASLNGLLGIALVLVLALLTPKLRRA
jgi:MFS family permease